MKALAALNTQLRAYFPRGNWFGLWSGQSLKGEGDWKLLEDIPYQVTFNLIKV